MALLEARELYRFYHSGDEEVRALRGVDVQVEAGELIALMGPSGSGKSTLLLCLAGLDEPDGGDVIVLGERMTRRSQLTKSELRSRTMGIMLQTNNLFDHLSIEQNVSFAQRMFGLQDVNWSNDVLMKIGLTQRQRALPAELSGGERARASIAVALARKPKILMLDEPTGEVDADAEAAIITMLKHHCDGGGAVIVATHNTELAKNATRVVPIQDGRIFHG